MAGLTPSQTIGPFFAAGLRWAITATARAARGDEITIEGRVLDADGKPLADALVEVWQPATSGDALGGLQRIATDAGGGFRFHVARDAVQVNVVVLARGLLKAACTRVHLAADRVPAAVPPARVHTLVALPTANAGRFAWDIRLGGEHETVFFAL